MKLTVVCPKCEAKIPLTLERTEEPKEKDQENSEQRRYHGPGLLNRRYMLHEWTIVNYG